jgi:hypothetical protein
VRVLCPFVPKTRDSQRLAASRPNRVLSPNHRPVVIPNGTLSSNIPFVCCRRPCAYASVGDSANRNDVSTYRTLTWPRHRFVFGVLAREVPTKSREGRLTAHEPPYDLARSFRYRAQRFFCAAAIRFRAAADSPCFCAGFAEGVVLWSPVRRARMSSIALVSRPASI